MGDERWALSVDREKCIGSGMCSASAPDHFDLTDGRAQPVHPELDADELVLEAAESCPVEAIRLVELSTGTVLAPEE